MASPNAAWGMEVGSYAIKAIRVERSGNKVVVSDFAVIPHKKVLTTPDLDQDEMVRLGLGQFISQKALEGEHLVMSVPGHAAFARFAKLPPVEPKKVPDIVKFEAVQQIPFPIDQVEWDYQTFMSDDSPEVEVGIFAITRDRVQQRLSLYSELDISPESLTLSPVAVYNAMHYDLKLDEQEGAIIFLDIGTSATDLIVAESGRCWIRTFPLGGSHFTDAIASAFKLSYSKADKLKQEAATSKYAKQIMQAMRPVFSDLLQDIQRSIGYYQSLHRESELTNMIGLGSTFKIPGLRKFLGQQLQMNVIRLDEYRRIAVKGREAASFAENAVNMSTAYGLALQGVGLATIDANLVPTKTLRDQMWHAKTKWFAAAAAVVVIGAGMTFYRPVTDRAALHPGGVPPTVTQALDLGNQYKSQFDEESAKDNLGFSRENMRRLVDYRDIWPTLVQDVGSALMSTEPQPELLSGELDKILAVPPQERRLVQFTRLDGTSYVYDAEDKSRRIDVLLEVEVTQDPAVPFLNATVAQWLKDNAEPEGERAGVPYRILNVGVGSPRPLTVSSAGAVEQDDKKSESSRPRRGGDDDRRGRSGSSGGPAQPGGGGFSTSGGGGGAQTIGQKEGPRKAAPGRGFGTSGGSEQGRSGGGVQGVGGQDRGGSTRPDWKESGKGGQDQASMADVDQMAPMPDAPVIYPADSRFFKVPITFTIEILEPGAVATPETTASRQSDGKEERS